MKLNIKRFAETVGVSVRTLHYYDKIGLLKPDFTDKQNGYRFYGDAALFRMQEILFYRELDFSLTEIKEMLSLPEYDKQAALREQKQLLTLKKQHLERIIEFIEQAEKGESINMKVFDNSEFEQAKEAYRREAEQRFGSTEAYKQHKEKTAGYGKADWQRVGEEINAIISEFAALNASGVKPTDGKAALLAQRLQNYITETQYDCTNEIFCSLGEMYVADNRFRNNINKHGFGTAEFMRDAVKAYCQGEPLE